jgi:hypothetical protein
MFEMTIRCRQFTRCCVAGGRVLGLTVGLLLISSAAAQGVVVGGRVIGADGRPVAQAVVPLVGKLQGWALRTLGHRIFRG